MDGLWFVFVLVFLGAVVTGYNLFTWISGREDHEQDE